jgi:hypothetical protein
MRSRRQTGHAGAEQPRPVTSSCSSPRFATSFPLCISITKANQAGTSSAFGSEALAVPDGHHSS